MPLNGDAHGPDRSSLGRSGLPRRTGPVLAGVVRNRVGDDGKLDGSIALSVRALGRAMCAVAFASMLLARSDIAAANHTLKHLERKHGLVKGHLMATLVDADKGKLAALLDLSVDLVVAGRDVDIASLAPAWSAYSVGNRLHAVPVADKVSITRIQRDSDALLEQQTEVLDSVDLAAIVAGPAERVAHNVRVVRVVGKCAKGLLHLGRVEVVDVKVVREWVGAKLADVIVITEQVPVHDTLDLVAAEVVRIGACGIVASGLGALLLQTRLAAIGAVHVFVQLLRDRLVDCQVVGVARRHGEVVKRLVANNGVEPAIANQQTLKVDLLGTRDVGGVLLLKVLAKDGAVVAAVRLGSKVDAVARVLRERAHEALQGLPQVGRGGVCRVGHDGRLGVGKGAACAVHVSRALAVRKSMDVAIVVHVAVDGLGVGEADSGGLVNEDHVADLGEGVRVVVGLAVVVDAARAEFLEKTNHGRRARAAVDPDGQRRVAGVDIAGLEEPEEHVLVLGDIGEAREALDLGVQLADTIRDLLVADRDAGMARDVLEALGLGDELGGGIVRNGSSSDEEHTGKRGHG